MKNFTILMNFVLFAFSTIVFASDQIPAPSHGIVYPQGWQSWSTIAISHRNDNNTIRLILGNDIAVKAAREGEINPWPDGAIIGKVVWKDTPLESWEDATVPGGFIHTEFMFKNTEKYHETYGWGWGRWLGIEQKPFNNGAKVCISCHMPVREQDWVFTKPAVFPK